ncbi:MAG: hypothetical protein MUE44_31925 [Oscillatoriaceae cyanobacterium Prado104]|jgi:hypothetical protein|nr:hypothetical protein [Oscillatoriaceae cyanobacterium Prado104]
MLEIGEIAETLGAIAGIFLQKYDYRHARREIAPAKRGDRAPCWLREALGQPGRAAGASGTEGRKNKEILTISIKVPSPELVTRKLLAIPNAVGGALKLLPSH